MVTKGHLSFQEFETIITNTFIYESILKKIYMNTNIMNTQILKVTKGHFYVYLNLNLRSYGQLFVLVFQMHQYPNDPDMPGKACTKIIIN